MVQYDTYAKSILRCFCLMLFLGAFSNLIQAQQTHLNTEDFESSLFKTLGAEEFYKLVKNNPQILTVMKLDVSNENAFKPELLFFNTLSKKALPSTSRFKATDHSWLISIEDSNLVAGTEDQYSSVSRELYTYEKDQDENLITTSSGQSILGINWTARSASHSTRNAMGQQTSYQGYNGMLNGNWTNINKSQTEYDDSGNIVKFENLVQYAQYPDFNRNSRINFTYNSANRMSSRISQNRVLDNWVNVQKNTRAYAADTLLTEAGTEQWSTQQNKWLKSSLTEYYRNEAGLIDSAILSGAFETPDSLVKYRKYTNEFNESNKISKQSSQFWAGIQWSFISSQVLFNYDTNGNQSEYISQARSSEDGEWLTSIKQVFEYDENNNRTSTEIYLLNAADSTLFLAYAYKQTYDANGNETSFKYFYGDTFAFGSESTYNENNDLIKVQGLILNASNEIVKATNFSVYNYVSEMPTENPLLSINSIQDRPNDQGGYVEMKAGGDFLDSPAANSQTGYWLVWNKNGSNWENIQRIEYVEGLGNSTTIPVYNTKATGAEADASTLFDYFITAHTSQGAYLGRSSSMSGFAEDNIIPTQVEGVNNKLNGNQITFDWTPSNDNDVEGYFVFAKSEEAYTVENSLGYSNDTNIEINRPAEPGDYEFVVVALDKHNNLGIPSAPSAIQLTTSSEFESAPTTFELSQNYPNPFNPSTNISFDIPESAQVRLEIYDMLGRKVATLVNERKSAGSYTVSFDASRLASGLYLYRLEAAGISTATKQMMLVK